jgi:predicted nucleic acid-binding protein
VLAKCVFAEPDSATAIRVVQAADALFAPDFIHVELASIAAKKVRRGEAQAAHVLGAFDRAAGMLLSLVPAATLWRSAYQLAVQHGGSVYDGLYVALAMECGRPVLTADIRLVRRADQAGLSGLVSPLDRV